MLDQAHLFFQNLHNSHVLKCAGNSCSATCSSSPGKAGSKLSAVFLRLLLALSFDEAETADLPAEDEAETAERPVFDEAETADEDERPGECGGADDASEDEPPGEGS